MLFAVSPLAVVTNALMVASAIGKLTYVTHRAPERLVERADKQVRMGDYASGHDGDTIRTDGLATCIGVAIAGDCGEGAEGCDDRWIAHAMPNSMDPLQNIVDRVKSAIEEGLTNVRVQAVFMDPAAETGDYQAYAEEMNNRALSIIAAVAGGVSPTLHRASEWWFLTINADKSFSSGLIDQGDSENDGNESAEEFYDESD